MTPVHLLQPNGRSESAVNRPPGNTTASGSAVGLSALRRPRHPARPPPKPSNTMTHQPTTGDSGPTDSPAPENPPDYKDDYDLEAALAEARAGNPARLAGIALCEKNELCRMALLGDLKDTYRARCFLHLFEEAALNHNLADCQLLVDAGSHDVARYVDDGARPLHLVAKAGFAPGITLLLQAGCEPNESDRNGRTPLLYGIQSEEGHIRSRKRAVATLEALLDGNANPNIADDAGLLPLIWAASLSSPAVVRTLITAGANVNALDQEGNTPLTALFGEWALNHTAMVQRKLRLLLAAGADVNLTGVHRTPLDLASELNLTAAVRLLRAHGAN